MGPFCAQASLCLGGVALWITLACRYPKSHGAQVYLISIKEKARERKPGTNLLRETNWLGGSRAHFRPGCGPTFCPHTATQFLGASRFSFGVVRERLARETRT